MSLEWNEVKLEDVGKIITGKTPKTSIEDNYGGHIPFLTPSDDMNVKIIKYTNKTLTLKGLNEVKNCLIPKNSVCVSCIGSDLGKVVLTSEDTVTNQQINSIIVNEKFDYNFIYYTMILLGKQLNYMSKSSTAVPIINKSTFSNELIFVPSLEEQKKISSILSNIDAKIDNLDKINKNLQKQINILFKSFFINFEFYDGKYQETLFGEIPIEWNIILFKDILNERNEKSTNQDIPMYSVTLDGIQPRADIYKKKITAKTTKFKIIHKYDLIFGMPNSGYQYGIMYDEIGGVSSAYPVFEINGIQPRYVDLFIKNISNYFNDIVKSGSRMGQGIDKKVLLSKEIYVPPNEHLDKYYSIESKLLDLINHNLTEINNLTKLRDTLLPKLMSGEIDVSKINCDLKIIIRKIYIKSSKLFLWRYLSENQNYIKNTKSNETLLKSRTIHKINKFLAKFNARYRYYRQ